MGLAGWSYRVAVTVDNSGSSSALSYYQVPITISGSAYTSWAAHGNADGSDIRVTDSDGSTLIGHALERIDSANSVVYMLAKVPRVAASGSRTIYVYWGNASASSVSSYATTVGPSNAITGPTDVANQSNYPGYNSFSILVTLKNQSGAYASMNGQALLFVPTGSGHASGDKKTILFRSTDGGVTFDGGTAILTPTTGNNGEVLAVGEMTDGSLVACYTYDTSANRIAGKCKLYIAKSSDGGQTWSNLSTSPANQLAVPWTVGTDVGLAYGRVHQDASGNLLLPVYGQPSAAPRSSAYLLKCPAASDPTNGSNWTTLATIAPAGGSTSFDEAAICLVQGGTKWLAIVRDDGATGDLYACTSPDSTGSGTWTSPTGIGMPNVAVPNYNAVSPDLLRLSSGNILLSFGVRQVNSSSATRGVGHVLSTDDGATWIDRPAVMPLSYTAGATPQYNYGYPSAQQRSDGKIVAVGYHDGGGAELANVARWICDEDYVANGANVYTGCEATSDTVWSSVQANVTADTVRHNNGAKSFKIDNSAGSGQYAYAALWPSGLYGAAARRYAVSCWINYSQLQSGYNYALAIRDSSDVGRANMSFPLAGTIQWHNGAAWQNTGVSVPIDTWVKFTHRAATTATSLTGKIAKNNVDTGASQTQTTSGGWANSFRVSIGTNSGATASTGWIDDVYSHQYAATPPTVTLGGEQNAPSDGAAFLMQL